MKIVVLSSVFSLSFMAFGQGVQKPRPLSETPFSVNVKDRSSKLSPQPTLPESGHWAYDATISNPYDKPIFCYGAYLDARLDIYGNSCGSPDYSVRINFGKSDYTLELPPKSSFQLLEAGYTERAARESKLPVNLDETADNDARLEFCSRNALDLDCGFNCPSGAKYGERPTRTVNHGGGEIKYYCNSMGEDVPQAEALKCQEGYLPNAGTLECEIQCDKKHTRNPKTNACEEKDCGAERPNGGTWTEPTLNGTITRVCNYGSDDFQSLECNDPKDFYEPAGTVCNKKSRIFKLRPGQTNFKTQCATTSSNGAFMSAVNCKKNQAIVFGPYQSFPFGGHFRVTYHVGNIRNFASGDANTEAFWIDAVSTGQTHMRRSIKQSDLVNYPLRVDRFTVLQLYGFNLSFEDTRIETSALLKPDPNAALERRNADRWVQIVQEFTTVDAITNLETRVWSSNGVINVAGVDIEFWPN